jgi:hypothetical protein
MPHAGVYALASLISSVSAALILASGPSHTETRSLQGTVHDAKRGPSTYDGCRASPCQIAYRMHLLTLLCFAVAEYVHDPPASKFRGGLLLMGTLATGSFSYQEHGGPYALSPKGSYADHAIVNLTAHLSRVVYEGVLNFVERYMS